MIALGAMGFAYYQRYQQRAATPDEDATGPLPSLALKERVQQTRKLMYDLKQKLQSRFPFRARKPDDNQDDDEDDWDQL
jgi:hypothetical protein